MWICNHADNGMLEECLCIIMPQLNENIFICIKLRHKTTKQEEELFGEIIIFSNKTVNLIKPFLVLLWAI